MPPYSMKFKPQSERSAEYAGVLSQPWIYQYPCEFQYTGCCSEATYYGKSAHTSVLRVASSFMEILRRQQAESGRGDIKTPVEGEADYLLVTLEEVDNDYELSFWDLHTLKEVKYPPQGCGGHVTKYKRLHMYLP